ncbi:hypothetical protein J6590_018390 [Homalodisca vitripennis]|nr:hypothetical protein J6590_096053 [Homalodisca vitripennis]KAG8307517.1 hypothetical protein J6590_018390 [Homalodisca vitripennis]
MQYATHINVSVNSLWGEQLKLVYNVDTPCQVVNCVFYSGVIRATLQPEWWERLICGSSTGNGRPHATDCFLPLLSTGHYVIIGTVNRTFVNIDVQHYKNIATNLEQKKQILTDQNLSARATDDYVLEISPHGSRLEAALSPKFTHPYYPVNPKAAQGSL